MQRVLIIGSPGAGKSTLAHRLSALTGLPLYNLDRIHWLPGWIERDREEALGELRAVLVRDRWIIDGNYGSNLPVRLERADTVLWLDYPTRVCLKGVLRRWRQYRGTSRPDMTVGCPERLSLEFLFYVLRFRSAWQHRNARALARFGGRVIRHFSRAETERWLERLVSSEFFTDAARLETS